MRIGKRIRQRLRAGDRIELHYYPGRVKLGEEHESYRTDSVRCETGYYRGGDDSTVHIFREFVHTDEKSLSLQRGPIIVRKISDIEKIIILAKSGWIKTD